MTRIGMSVKADGPLFRKGNAILQQGVQDAIQELVEIGEQRLDEQARPRPGGVYLSVAAAQPGKASTGNYRRNINGFVKRMVGIITDGGVIYGPWLEGTSSRNQSTRFKGYAMFRRTRDWLQGKAKGVAEKHAKRIARKMGG